MVTTNDGSPPHTTINPLSNPASAPTSTPKTMAASIGIPCSRQTAINEAQSPIIDPTETSISPVIIIRVIGNATIATGVIPANAIERFDGVRKYRETWLPQTNVTIRTNSRNTSQRARTARSQAPALLELIGIFYPVGGRFSAIGVRCLPHALPARYRITPSLRSPLPVPP